MDYYMNTIEDKQNEILIHKYNYTYLYMNSCKYTLITLTTSIMKLNIITI